MSDQAAGREATGQDQAPAPMFDSGGMSQPDQNPLDQNPLVRRIRANPIGSVAISLLSILAAWLLVLPSFLPMLKFASDSYAALNVPPYLTVTDSAQVVDTNDRWTTVAATFTIKNSSGRNIRIIQSWFNLYGYRIGVGGASDEVPGDQYTQAALTSMNQERASQDTIVSRYALELNKGSQEAVLYSGQLVDTTPWFQPGREFSGHLLFPVKTGFYDVVRFRADVAISTNDQNICKAWKTGGMGELFGDAYLKTTNGPSLPSVPAFGVSHSTSGSDVDCQKQDSIREALRRDGPAWVGGAATAASRVASDLDAAANFWETSNTGASDQPDRSNPDKRKAQGDAYRDSAFGNVWASAGSATCALDRLQKASVDPSIRDAVDGRSNAGELPTRSLDYRVPPGNTLKGGEALLVGAKCADGYYVDVPRVPLPWPPGCPDWSTEASTTVVAQSTPLRLLQDATLNLTGMSELLMDPITDRQSFEDASAARLMATRIGACASELRAVSQRLESAWLGYWRSSIDDAYAASGLNLVYAIAEVRTAR
jgi:hypothetical protein